MIIFDLEIDSNFLLLGIRWLKLGGSLVGGSLVGGGGDTVDSIDAALDGVDLPGEPKTPNFLQSALIC